MCIYPSRKQRLATEELCKNASDAPEVHGIAIESIGTQHQLGGAVPAGNHVLGHWMVHLPDRGSDQNKNEPQEMKIENDNTMALCFRLSSKTEQQEQKHIIDDVCLFKLALWVLRFVFSPAKKSVFGVFMSRHSSKLNGKDK